MSVVDLYHALHPLAETSGHEVKTAAFIAEHLKDLGLEVQTSVGGTGVVAVIDSGKPGRGVMFRADMDALPFANEDGTISAVHACGHDAHCAMLLAAAPALKAIVKKGTLKLVFQPGEEDLTGAIAMINDGVLNGVQIAIGAHVRPVQDLSPGCMCSAVTHVACATIKTRFTGRLSHAARPHQGINPIDMAAQHINMVNSIRLNPNESWSVKATRCICEPGPTNSISNWVEVTYDLRAATNPLLSEMLETMQRQAQSVALAYGGKLEWTQLDYCPASDYDTELVELIEDVIKTEIGEDKLMTSPGGGGEDFHFFKLRGAGVQTAYFGVGAGCTPALHKRDMCLQPQYLVNGVKVWEALAKRLLS